MFLKNVSWLLVEKILRIFSSLFVGILFTRYLGPENFGIYSYGVSLIAIFSSISLLGLESITIKNIALYQHDVHHLIISLKKILFLSGTLMFIVTCPFIFFLTQNKSEFYLILIMAASLILNFSQTINYLIQGQSNFILLSKINISQIILSISIKIVLVYLKVDLLYFGVAFLLDAMILSFLYFRSYSEIEIYKSENLIEIKDMIIKSIPLIFSGLLLTLYMKIDQFMIKGLLGNISLGYFSLVIRITEASVIIPYAILQVFSPKIFVNENNLEESQKYFDISIIVAFTIAVTSTIFSRFIIITLFGIEYEPSILPFRICIWSILFLTFGQINYYLTISQNSQVVLLVKIFIGIIFNLTSCYILTSKYGIIGAAISTTLSYFFSAVFLVLFFKNQKWQFFAFLKSLFIPFTIIRLIKNSQFLKTI